MDADVKLLAAMLSEGDTLRTQCPKCEGGASNEASFSITRDADGIVYKCFRNKCGYSGGYGKKGSASVVHTTETPDDRTRDKIQRAKEVYARQEDLSDIQSNFLMNRFNYPVEDVLDCRWDPETHRLLVPLYSNGKLVGFVSRRFYEHSSPKAITYRLQPDEPMLGFYHGEQVSPLMIVEDVFSAGALAHLGHTSCALLGTGTSHEGWMEISRFATRYTEGRAIIALDEDASAEAVNTAQSKRNMFRNLWPFLLSGPDIKDMSPDARRELSVEILRQGR